MSKSVRHYLQQEARRRAGEWPEESAGALDRRAFVKTTSGLFIALGLAECRGATQITTPPDTTTTPPPPPPTAQTGTLRIAVTGLPSGASSGGSATYQRTDIAGQSPSSVNLPGSGSVDRTVETGDYRVTYTPPDGYAVNQGVSNPQTLKVNANATATASYAVSAGFATPDILNNASFESGWDGFTNPSGGTPSWQLSNEQAQQGTTSAKFTFGPGSGGGGMMFSFAGRDDVYFRTYFYATQFPNDAHKFMRFFAPALGNPAEGLNPGGNQRLQWVFVDNSNIGLDLGLGVPTLNAWHSFEVHYMRNGDTYPKARFWYEGKAVPGDPNLKPGTINKAFWDGEWLVAGDRSYTSKIGVIAFSPTINGGNSNSGVIYMDRVALSSKQIGP
jgi:hypothetical protein